MSTQSVNSLNINSIIFPSNVNRPSDLRKELQEAFESLDEKQIINLLSRGANPEQRIDVTYKLSDSLSNVYIEQCTRKELEGAILLFDEEYLRQFSFDEDFIQMALQVKKDIQENIEVSMQLLKKVAMECSRCEMDYAIKVGDVPAQKPINIAAMIRNVPILEKLIECGSNLSDLMDFQSISLSYTELEKELLAALEDLQQLGVEVPVETFQNPFLSIKERVEKMQSFICSIQDQYTISTDGPTYFFGLTELIEMNRKDIDFVDFLFLNGIPIENIFYFSVFHLVNVLNAENYLEILSYLKDKGFNLQDYTKELEKKGQYDFLNSSEKKKIKAFLENEDTKLSEKRSLLGAQKL